MKVEDAKKLRAPFKPEQIGKLPKPTKRENPKGKCAECGGWHGLPAIHLDYVGHAAVTDRLLDVDAAYEFKPSLDDQGHPIVRGQGQSMEVLYSLTVCGVTRYEWGEGPNMKECESDAIRRCAMRFGVALDLWSKEDLQAGAEERPTAPATPAKSAATRTPLPSGSSPTPDRGAHASPKQEKLIRDLVAKIRKRDAEHTAVKWYDSQPPISEWPIVTVSAAIGRLQGALKALEVPELPPDEAAFVAKAQETFDADSVPF